MMKKLLFFIIALYFFLVSLTSNNELFRFEDFDSAKQIEHELNRRFHEGSELKPLLSSLEIAGAICVKAEIQGCWSHYSQRHNRPSKFEQWLGSVPSKLDYSIPSEYELIGKQACENVLTCRYSETSKGLFFTVTRLVEIFIKHNGHGKVIFVEARQWIKGLP